MRPQAENQTTNTALNTTVTPQSDQARLEEKEPVLPRDTGEEDGRLVCVHCGKPIGDDEVRIYIPDCSNVEGEPGHHHRDCGICAEAGEDGLQFYDNVERLFAVLGEILNAWCDAEMVLDDMLPAVNREVEKLNSVVRDYWARQADVDGTASAADQEAAQ